MKVSLFDGVVCDLCCVIFESVRFIRFGIVIGEDYRFEVVVEFRKRDLERDLYRV